ncbi:MAG: S8 family peptidase [Armatimonadetes bacterium]|nr:S8 family peptidase [Armatimonadota bacterium]
MKTRSGVRTVCALGTVGAMVCALGQSPVDKLDTALQQKVTHHRTSTVRVIAQIRGAWNRGRAEQAARIGGWLFQQYPALGTVALSVPSRNLLKLASLPYVTRLSYDGPVAKCDEFTVRSSMAATAWAAPYKLSGSGIGVAVVDSGVQDCDDLRTNSTKRVVASVSFNQSNTNDTCGHGTHVSGIIAGNGFASTGTKFTKTFYGIAPKANIVAVKVLDSLGSGTVSNVLAGINWVVTNKAKYNIKVMNLSLGHSIGERYKTDPLCKAVETAWKSGIVVVCAAGNNGRAFGTNVSGRDNEGWGTSYGSIQSPANDPYVITVGATKAIGMNRADDRIATYSSRGPSRLDLVLKPDLVAPGNRVISLEDKGAFLAARYVTTNEVPVSFYTLKNYAQPSPNYFYLSGTSMASPVVAGAAALMLQMSPMLSPDTVKARLMVSATKMTRTDGYADPFSYGAGYLDIPGALNSTVVATQSSLSPKVGKDSYGNPFILTDDVWGDKALWGTGLTNLRCIWGSKALWGSSQSYLDGSRAAWGSSVWGDKALWGTSTGAVDLTSVAIGGE